MKYITLLILMSVLTGCKNLVQVVETKTTNTQIIDDQYIFENDSIKISYDFWREKGSLKFTVYNKLDKPLYIDWKKSSYINNTIKRNYWADEENSVTDSYTLYDYNESVGRRRTRSTKPEKITFIPPKSNFVKDHFYIYPTALKVVYLDKIKRKSLSNPNKEIEIKEKQYLKSNSPLIFRNFLTLSYSEDFKTEFYVDNEFYISKVFELDALDFSGYKKDPNRPKFYLHDEFGERIPIGAYMSKRSFFIRITK